jgi:hypothetical protein
LAAAILAQVRTGGATQYRTKHRVAHPPEIAKALMPVNSDADVNLRHGVQAGKPQSVDQQPSLYAISGEERDREQQFPGAGEFPGQGLGEAS